MSTARTKIQKKLQEVLVNFTADENASNLLAEKIERQVNKVCPQRTDESVYLKRARDLIFNLKHNPKMSISVVKGEVSPHELLNLSEVDLATDSQKSSWRERDSLKLGIPWSDRVPSHTTVDLDLP